ncbi:btb poz domain containing [Pyrenophora seminiperda CCB06]|uniref:Btb poz domain containing n=1 Tax=Pyrenophora seminiperda CCB06 TaxID=1302712 RepID=A0A3M7M768_9PLEO|nr:btb poz domain containing [Pyrenophora seminiperda CCB06]
MRTIIPRSSVGTDSSTRIPTPNLPPPYTFTGDRSGQSRSANISDFTSTTKLVVGPKATLFHIHTSLLTTKSLYFRAALTGPYTESTENSVKLDDVCVEHFELLISWLYNGVLPAPFKDRKPAYYTLLHAYVLADRFAFEGLRNAVVDTMSDLADRTNSVLTPSDTRILYDGIRDSAPLRRLVLDLFAFKKTDRLLETHGDWWHAGFLRDLGVLLKRPCGQALARHRLRLWCPETWLATRACEHCRAVLPPRVGAVACEDCCVAFCTRCIEGGVAMAGWDEARARVEGEEEGKRDYDGDTEGGAVGEACKPWRGARCALYHEHDETKGCGDFFLGR